MRAVQRSALYGWAAADDGKQGNSRTTPGELEHFLTAGQRLCIIAVCAKLVAFFLLIRCKKKSFS